MIVKAQSTFDNFSLVLEQSRFLLKELNCIQNLNMEKFNSKVELAVIKKKRFHPIVRIYRNKKTLELSSFETTIGYLDNEGNIYNSRKIIRGNIYHMNNGLSVLSNDGYIL